MKKFFSLIAAVLFAGSMMATEVTVSKTVEELATANSWANGTVVTPFALDDVITVSTNATDGNTGKYYTSGQQIRLYQSGAAELIISAAEGYTISSITVEYVSEKGGIFAETASGVAVPYENVQSATFTVANSGEATNGQARVTAISVTYNGEGGVTPPPVDTYTVAGNDAAIFGTSWDVTNTANDMVKAAGIYKWEKAELNLTAGTIIAFKVAKNHSWDVAYPAQNDTVTIAEAGEYTLTITFDPTTETVAAEAVKKEPVVIPQYEVAEAIAAGLADDTEILVRGVITGMEFKGKNFAKYGSVNIYVADATGAEGAFEFYNCYSLNADTFRTSDPAYDAESTAWAQFNEVADENGNAIHVGDTVIAFGKYKLYNETYELNTGCYLTEIKHPGDAPVEHTFTVAGSSDVLFGTAWDPTNTANDMALVEGLYTWEKSELTLAAGNILFKVCEDHAWTTAYPAQNYELNIPEAGIYTVTITFNAETKEVAAVATKTGEAVVVPTVAMHGNFLGSWADTENFAIAQDNASASLTLTLAEGNYEFGMRIGGSGNWTANGANLTREANTTNLAEGSGNMHIAADVAGDYVFTYTYETQILEVVYPEAPGEEINVTISSLTNPGQVLYADAIASYGYWDIYAYNDQYQIEISNTYTTEAAGTYTIDDLDAKYTYIVPAEGDTVHFTAGQVVLSITDGVVNVAGKLTGDDNNIYNINLTYKDPVAEQTVNVNIPKGVLYDGYATSGLYAVYGSAEDGTYVQLAIWAEAGFEGEFTEDDLDNQYVGSGLKDAAGNTQQIYTAAITVTPGAIEGAYTITADLLCYNNTLYKVTMSIGGTEGIEDVEAAQKVVKMIQKGQLIIEKNGVRYNANGQIVR